MSPLAFLGLVWGLRAGQVASITGATSMPSGDMVVVRELAGRRAAISFSFVKRHLYAVRVLFVDRESYVDTEIFMEAQPETRDVALSTFEQVGAVLEEGLGLPKAVRPGTQLLVRWDTDDTAIELTNSARAGTALYYQALYNPAYELLGKGESAIKP